MPHGLVNVYNIYEAKEVCKAEKVQKKGLCDIFINEHIWASFEKQNLIEIRRISYVTKMKHGPDLRSEATSFRAVGQYLEENLFYKISFFSRTKEVCKAENVQNLL